MFSFHDLRKKRVVMDRSIDRPWNYDTFWNGSNQPGLGRWKNRRSFCSFSNNNNCNKKVKNRTFESGDDGDDVLLSIYLSVWTTNKVGRKTRGNEVVLITGQTKTLLGQDNNVWKTISFRPDDELIYVLLISCLHSFTFRLPIGIPAQINVIIRSRTRLTASY